MIQIFTTITVDKYFEFRITGQVLVTLFNGYGIFLWFAF